ERLARRRRLVVGDVENPRCFARQCRVDRLRDILDMDAVESLSGLDDAARIAARYLCQRVATRPVDAGEAKHGDRNAAAFAEILPAVFGAEPSGATRRVRLGLN